MRGTPASLELLPRLQVILAEANVVDQQIMIELLMMIHAGRMKTHVEANQVLDVMARRAKLMLRELPL